MRELIYAEDVYTAKFTSEKLQHIRQLVESLEDSKYQDLDLWLDSK